MIRHGFERHFFNSEVHRPCTGMIRPVATYLATHTNTATNKKNITVELSKYKTTRHFVQKLLQIGEDRYISCWPDDKPH